MNVLHYDISPRDSHATDMRVAEATILCLVDIADVHDDVVQLRTPAGNWAIRKRMSPNVVDDISRAIADHLQASRG